MSTSVCESCGDTGLVPCDLGGLPRKCNECSGGKEKPRHKVPKPKEIDASLDQKAINAAGRTGE